MKFIPLNQIFDINYGNKFDLYKLKIDQNSDINFVSRTSQNLGVICKVSPYNSTKPFPPGLITVTLGGTYLLSSFIQQNKFYTAQNIKVLTPKKEMSYNQKIYYCKAIESNRFRYTSHGREANITLDSLLVPETVPLEFLHINIDTNNLVNKHPINRQSLELNQDSWKYFYLTSLFNITGSKTTPLKDLNSFGKGIYPYVTTQSTNNGIEGYYNYYTEKGNVLCIDSAVVGYCSYQNENFSASDHVEKLIPKFPFNKYIAIFLVGIINKEQYRYNYGIKCCQERIRKAKIKLPTKNNMPDWNYMENYIKSLPYSKTL